MVLALIFRAYRVVLSPAIELVFNIHCRYEESCSRYAERMIREAGFVKGIGLGARRLLSCNQWSRHG